MSHKWTDLYTHGERLNWLCKRFYTEFKKAEEDDNKDLMIIYGEALRKVTMNCVDVKRCLDVLLNSFRVSVNCMRYK